MGQRFHRLRRGLDGVGQ
ncbi:hypothetical protein CFB34_035840 [Burkholderia sp. HI4860]|nr:hypothetical protein [Burkholderia sp. HI4860]MCI3974353.1 hypothetical protein [Burkholderia sp. HI4860]